MPLKTETQNSDKQPQPRDLSRRLLLLLVLILLINLSVLPSPKTLRSETPYSIFIEQVEAGQVNRAIIGPNRIEYTFEPELGEADQPPLEFFTIPVATDTDLLKILRAHNVEFSASPPSNMGWISALLVWVLLPVAFLWLWAWLSSRTQDGGAATLAVGRSKARVYAEGSTGVTFADVAGIDEAKVELLEIVDFLKNADRYVRLGARIPKGVLLVGPPGTGKTMLAKAIAGEASVPFFSISGSEFVELFVGIGAARVRDLFEQAKKQAPCIAFIDELDALGKSRGVAGVPFTGGNDEREQTLNQLLAEMDGFDTNTGVIILAATNRPEVLDAALRRPGRFDRQVAVDPPDRLGREAILRVHARQVQLALDVELEKIAARTAGFVGADLANLVNEAALLAARKNEDGVTMADFNEALERVVAGLEKRSRVLNELEKKTVAYHEVGHAIVGTLMPGAGEVEKISIVPRGLGALGYTLQLPEEDRFLMVESELRGRIATLLAGRSAEELIFGEISTGASDDIQKATDFAERATTLYGMSKVLGPVAFEKHQQYYLEGHPNPRRSIGPRVTEEIDLEVKAVIDGAHHIAWSVLKANRDLLETMAQLLLQQEILEGEELRSHLKQVRPSADLDRWLHPGHCLDDRQQLQSTLP